VARGGIASTTARTSDARIYAIGEARRTAA
jgi:hypothetical protein